MLFEKEFAFAAREEKDASSRIFPGAFRNALFPCGISPYVIPWLFHPSYTISVDGGRQG